MEIKIKYFSDIQPIEKIEIGNWVDLRAADDFVLDAGDFAIIPLGIGMKLPEGYEAHVVPRSSTYKKWGIIQTNSVGIIDNSYSGDNDQWMMPVLAMRDTHISKNDRICQFRIVKKQPEIEFTTVEKLDDISRNGFGSIGAN